MASPPRPTGLPALAGRLRPAGHRADIDVGLAEDGEQVAGAGLLEQFLASIRVG